MRVPVPKEHGAWAMLSTSLVFGLAVAGRLNAAGLYLAGAAVLVFTARQPLFLLRKRNSGGQWTTTELRRWSAGFLAGAGFLGLLLLGERGPGVLLFLLPAVGLFFLQFAWQRPAARRSWPAEIAGVAGVTLTAPAAYYAATGGLGPVGASLWPVLFAYFVAGVVHVRGRLRHPGDRRRAGGNLLVQAVLAGGVLVLGGLSILPPYLFLAFLPNVVKAGADLAQTAARPRPRVQRVGWAEVAYSLLFFFLALAAYVA